MKEKKKIFINFIPFIGYLITLFWGAHQIKKKFNNHLLVFIYGFLSLIILGFFSALIYLIIYYFIWDYSNYFLKLFFVLLLFYIDFICAGLSTSIILKLILAKN